MTLNQIATSPEERLRQNLILLADLADNQDLYNRLLIDCASIPITLDLSVLLWETDSLIHYWNRFMKPTTSTA